MEDYFYEPKTSAFSFADEAEEIDDRFFSDEEDGDDEGDDLDGEPVGPDDLSDDGEALASVGWGTDEDYGYDGGDEW